MLVLSRRPGESVTLLYGDIEIVVRVDDVRPHWRASEDRIVLSFDAPVDVAIIRTELMERA